MGVIRMARPVRRKGSSNGQFRKRIPKTAVEITRSLRTASKIEIDARHAQATSYLKGVYAALRSDTPRMAALESPQIS